MVADARLRRGVYTPKGVRAVYTYTGSHAKTIVFGLITADGNGFFKRYGRFTKDEFADFLEEAHQRFGKILMIVDGAPQHKAQIVKETVKDLDGLELKFLPPGCSDLNAIEELAPDEARRAGQAVRQIRPDVQGHQRVARVVHAGTGHRKVSLQGGIGREPAHRAGDHAHAVPRCRVIRRRFPTDPPARDLPSVPHGSA